MLCREDQRGGENRPGVGGRQRERDRRGQRRTAGGISPQIETISTSPNWAQRAWTAAASIPFRANCSAARHSGSAKRPKSNAGPDSSLQSLRSSQAAARARTRLAADVNSCCIIVSLPHPLPAGNAGTFPGDGPVCLDSPCFESYNSLADRRIMARVGQDGADCDAKDGVGGVPLAGIASACRTWKLGGSGRGRRRRGDVASRSVGDIRLDRTAHPGIAYTVLGFVADRLGRFRRAFRLASRPGVGAVARRREQGHLSRGFGSLFTGPLGGSGTIARPPAAKGSPRH